MYVNKGRTKTRLRLTCCEQSPVVFPHFPKDSGYLYRDQNDPEARNTKSWSGRALNPGLEPEDETDLCWATWEHRPCVITIGQLCQVNQDRRRANPGRMLPVLRFYAVVQHEGEALIIKRNIPHVVVNIGMTFALGTSMVEPQHARKLWDNNEGERLCACPDGLDGDERPTWDLELRNLKGNREEGMEEDLF